MSVISRMLRDLESRDARAASPRDADDRPRHFPARPPRRARRSPRAWLRRAAPALLAVSLLILAAALWWQRAPRWSDLIAGWGGSAVEPAERPAASAPPTPAARLAAARFSGAGEQATLALVIDGEPREQPGYARRGTTLALRVPAPAEGVSLPAPPDGQRVFRSASMRSDSDGATTIRLQVADGASFDLQREGGRLHLVGRVPEVPEAVREDVAALTAATETALAESPSLDADQAQAEEDSEPPDAAENESEQPSEPGHAGDDEPSSSSEDASSASPEPPEPDRETGATSAEAAPTSSPGEMRKNDRSTPEVRAQRRYSEARAALAQGELGGARRRLHGALELDGDLHGARDLLVTLYRRAGDADSARDVLAEGFERAPRRLAYAKPYARLLVDAGDLERAARVLQGARVAGREDADYHALAAAVAQRRGRHEEAAAAYTRALEIDGGNGRWWLGLGVALSAADHPGEAAASFREARRTGTLPQSLDEWARSRIEALEQAS
ncbi:MAG: tetratricopeptide repeat protein [Halofilum sp. (in: g-proteobacteria)]